MPTPEWMQAALSVGTGAGGTGVLVLALKVAVPELAKWLRSRARAEEVTAETVRSMLDEMRERVAEIQKEAKEGQRHAASEVALYKERAIGLEKKLIAQQREIEEMHRSISTLRPSIRPAIGTQQPAKIITQEIVVQKKERD